MLRRRRFGAGRWTTGTTEFKYGPDLSSLVGSVGNEDDDDDDKAALLLMFSSLPPVLLVGSFV